MTKVTGQIKLQIPAGNANPAPPIGPALGQAGVNIMEFCKQFNAATKQAEPGVPTPVVITVFGDRTFTFQMKTPPASYFIRKAAGLDGGSKEPGRTVVGRITMKQVREIAEKKMQDLNANDVDAASKMIVGSARSMGITVQE